MTSRLCGRIVPALLVLAIIPSGCRPTQNSSWAIINASIVDVANGNVLSGQTIHINGRSIIAVGPTAELPLPGVPRIDAHGAFVVPGLFHMHAHVLAQQPASRYVAEGITAVRDLGSPLGAFAAIDSDEESVIRPTIWSSGPVLDAPRASGTPANRHPVQNEDEARTAVATIAASGVDFIKVHDWLTLPVYTAVAEAARARGLPLVGHLPAAVTIDEAFSAGQKSIEHLGGLTLGVLRECTRTDSLAYREVVNQVATRVASESDFNPPAEVFMTSAHLTPLLDGFEPALCTALAQRLARADVWQLPNLVLWRAWIDFVPPSAPALSSEDRAARRRLFDTNKRIVEIMHQAGVPILAGVDEIRGATLHDELELLVDAGLAPGEALQAATINAARFLGVSDSYGSVAPDHVADFILIDGDPLVDIGNLRRIRSVVLRGEHYDRASISGWLEN